MKTILVTGGAGFIGSNFAHLLLSQTDNQVVVLDKLTYAGSMLNLPDVDQTDQLSFEQADIADPQAAADVMRKYNPDWVINFAAESHVDRSIDDPQSFVQTNIVGTYVMLEAARQYVAASSKAERGSFRFLHVSTDEVYGSLGPSGLFQETTPYAPNSPYAASKASADHLARAYYETYGLPVLITNCSNNYGPHQFPEKLIPLMILNALEGKSLPIYGDGKNVRDWLYVEDHCKGILIVLESGKVGEKYNLGGNNELTNLMVIDALCAVLEKLRPAAENEALQQAGKSAYQDLKVFVADRPGHDKRYAIDTHKVQSELGWSPAHDFEAGLECTVKWYLENTDWCSKIQDNNYQRERLGLSSDKGGSE